MKKWFVTLKRLDHPDFSTWFMAPNYNTAYSKADKLCDRMNHGRTVDIYRVYSVKPSNGKEVR